jgi:hypothetical protein
VLVLFITILKVFMKRQMVPKQWVDLQPLRLEGQGMAEYPEIEKNILILPYKFLSVLV